MKSLFHISLKTLLTGIWIATSTIASFAQTTYTLDSCLSLSRANFPLVKQLDLIEKTKEYSVSNASKGYLPQVSFNGFATYQSDVIQFPFSVPGVEVPTLSQDQYRITGEVSQPLTDLFTLSNQTDLTEANAEIQKSSSEIELYSVKERVVQLYFGILLIDEQIAQTELLRQDLQRNIRKLEIAIDNGVSLPFNADVLKAEDLKIGQALTTLHSQKAAYLQMLGIFVGQPLNDNTDLEIPNLSQSSSSEIKRPELQLFANQKEALNLQSNSITNRNLPRFSLFFQGGYGRPGLNPLDNDFQLFYVTGIRMQWNLFGLYTSSKEHRIIDVNRQSVDVQEETFRFNTALRMSQQNEDILKLRELLNSDDEIIALRHKIRITAEQQLEEGTLTGIDFLEYVNAENKATQDRALHEIQLLMAKVNQLTISGNL